MSVLDKLRDMASHPADTDLLGYFGLTSGSQLSWTADLLTVGDEVVPMAEVRTALRGGRIHNAVPTRTVTIGEL